MNWLFQQSDWQTPGLVLRVRLRPEVGIEELPDGGLNVTHVWGTLQFAGIDPRVTATLRRLASRWVERTELLSIAAECGTSDVQQIATLVSAHIWCFNRLGFLFMLQLAWNGRPLLTVEPLSYASSLDLGNAVRESAPRLSRFAFLQRHAEGLAMESAVSTHRVVLHDDWGAALIGTLAREASQVGAPDLDDPPVAAALDFLGAAGMLEGREQIPGAGFGHELLEMGEFHDLLFHRRSRFGRHDGLFGAEFPYLGQVPSGPALAPPLADTAIPLPRPAEDDVRSRDLTLTQAMERRSSSRDHGREPLTIAQLGEFLFRCARVRGQYGPAAGMPYLASDRPYPSGGGIHDLELYLIVSRVQNLPAGVYHYAAGKHALELLPANEDALAILVRSAMQASAARNPPQVLIKITSRFARMSWKYRSISYATTLKNVGVLYQTMYLVATALGLAG